MAAIQITGEDVQDMARHWLGCPVYGYLGDDYGNDLYSLLQQPLSGVQADALISKLRTDVPVLNALDDQAVGLYWSDNGVDRKTLTLRVGANLLVAGEGPRTVRTTRGG